MNIKHQFDSSIIRSYDIRGIYKQTLFEKDARVIGQLFGLKVGKGNTVNIGYDGRHSSKALKESLINGILDTGANICEIGLVPTPILYFSCVTKRSKGGIMVTGSHNPKDYNGFKFVYENLPFYGDDLKKLEKKAKNFSVLGKLGKRTIFDFQTKYINNIFRNYSQKKKN